jgi:hypothetical protein
MSPLADSFRHEVAGERVDESVTRILEVDYMRCLAMSEPGVLLSLCSGVRHCRLVHNWLPRLRTGQN